MLDSLIDFIVYMVGGFLMSVAGILLVLIPSLIVVGFGYGILHGSAKLFCKFYKSKWPEKQCWNEW